MSDHLRDATKKIKVDQSNPVGYVSKKKQSTGTTPQAEWSERFDKEFVTDSFGVKQVILLEDEYDELKCFIQSEIDAAYVKGYQEGGGKLGENVAHMKFEIEKAYQRGFKKGFIDGFDDTGEGYNGEYGATEKSVNEDLELALSQLSKEK
jgi:hypothetical protein